MSTKKKTPGTSWVWKDNKAIGIFYDQNFGKNGKAKWKRFDYCLCLLCDQDSDECIIGCEHSNTTTLIDHLKSKHNKVKPKNTTSVNNEQKEQ